MPESNGVRTIEADATPLIPAIPPPAAHPASMSFDPMALAMSVAPFYSTTYLAGIAQLAKAAVASRLYGDLNESQATMILQTGMEWGITPTVALRNIGSFKGKTTITSALMLAKVKQAGYQEKIIENTADAAEIRIQKAGREPYSVRYTMADAKLAGLPERNALYRTDPAVMLLNRAIGRVCRYGAPEVAAGIYVADELDGTMIEETGERPPQGIPGTTGPAGATGGATGSAIPAEKGGAPAGSTVRRRAPAKASTQDPGSGQQPSGAPIQPYPWTDVRKDWIKARATELGLDADEQGASLGILDAAGDPERKAFVEALKAGDVAAARAAVEKARTEATE